MGPLLSCTRTRSGSVAPSAMCKTQLRANSLGNNFWAENLRSLSLATRALRGPDRTHTSRTARSAWAHNAHSTPHTAYTHDRVTRRASNKFKENTLPCLSQTGEGFSLNLKLDEMDAHAVCVVCVQPECRCPCACVCVCAYVCVCICGCACMLAIGRFLARRRGSKRASSLKRKWGCVEWAQFPSLSTHSKPCASISAPTALRPRPPPPHRPMEENLPMG